MTSYLGITGHYIDPTSNGSAWELEEDIIGFKELSGSHSGINLAEYVVGVLTELGIEAKVCDELLILTFKYLRAPQLGWITTDNASNNDTMVAGIESLLREKGIEWDAATRHIRLVFYFAPNIMC